MIIPNGKIVAISYDEKWQTQEYVDLIFQSLKNHNTREWFIEHAYHCLPLVVGNQHGFVLKSLYNFEVSWDGGNWPDSVKVNILDTEEYEKYHNLQSIKSHFGMGTFTIQTPYQLRTPPQINLMTINPPNSFIDGLYHMTGIVETDNLRRDFTYNIRITRKDHIIKVNKGDFIGCIMPYPRHFIDKFSVTDASGVLTEQEISEEKECANKLGIQRETEDKEKRGRNGKRYWRGMDAYDNKFSDHQTGLDN